MPYDDDYVIYLQTQIANLKRQQGTGQHRNVQRLPSGNTSQRQAEMAARQGNANTRTRAPAQSRYIPVEEVLDEGEYDDIWPPRLSSSSIRYFTQTNGQPAPGVYKQGNTTVRYHGDVPLDYQHAIPPRRSQQHQQQPINNAADQEEIEQPVTRVRRRPKLKVHWFVYLSIGLFILIAAWQGFNAIGYAWQRQLDDWQYGNPRTYQIDAVVGHSDSSTSPSHFIALNLKGQIIVLELPGGNTNSARSYAITTLTDNQANPPVKLVFQDVNHDGKLDMIVEIGHQDNYFTVIFFNDGQQFVSKLK